MGRSIDFFPSAPDGDLTRGTMELTIHPDERMIQLMPPVTPDNLLRWMDSLADAARLRVLHLVERQELGVAELCDVLQMPQSTVSRHLKLLGDQGWIQARREGTANLYRMSVEELPPPAKKLWLLAREQSTGWRRLEQDELRLKRVLAERQGDAQSFFAGAAGQWDTLRDWLYGRSFTFQAMLALLPADWVVADLGCGTGSLAAQLSPHVKQVIAVDQSPEMLKAARQRTTALANVQVRKGQLHALPIEPASCDAALCVLVLSYIQEPTAVLHEAQRILKPGGPLVIVDLLEHDREDFRRHMGQVSLGFTPARLRSLVEQAGLQQQSFQELPPEAEAKGPALFLARAARNHR